MTTKTTSGRVWLSTIAVLSVVALLVAAGLAFVLTRPSGRSYSAMFDSAIGLYPGADVRVLGVPVGGVDTVTPEGTLVRVSFHVDPDVQVPANAMAAVVAPTVVADRYLQLAPVYTGGPTLAEGAVIPKERTASPAEFDDLLASVQKLSTSLGPQGVNQNGALSEALSTFARNLDGNGQRLNTSLDNFSQAITTLSASRDDLAGTVRNLQSFTTNLKQNDNQVRAFTQQFAEVNGYLASEREDLGETLHELSLALGEVAVFIHDNRAEIRDNVDKLGEILGTVNRERLGLEQFLDTAPIALSGLVNSYDASSGTLHTRANLVQSVVCVLANNAQTAPVLGPILAPVLADWNIDCTKLGSALALPPLPAGTLSQLKLPKQPLLFGSDTPAVPSVPALPPANGLPAPGAAEQRQDTSTPTERTEPSKATKPPSLGDLFGGGDR